MIGCDINIQETIDNLLWVKKHEANCSASFKTLNDAVTLIKEQQKRIKELEAELGQRDYNAAVEMQQYDFSGWTTEMIVAKIREIERKKEIAYKEYIDLVASFNSQLRALYNPLSNENHFNCDEPPKEET